MMKIVASHHARGLRVVAKASTTTAAPQTLKALNITKSNLVDSQGGRATRNLDGIVYTITYDASADKISIVDRVNRKEYDAAVGAKDNRISLVWDTARPAPGGPASFEQLQSILKGDAPGPEIINGRVAMTAFLGTAIVEAVSGQPFLAQAATPAGAAAAAGLVLLTTLASVAPALIGAVPAEKVLPSANDSFSDRQLPYYFTPLAEVINGRAAMIGLAGLIINEVVRGAAVF